MNKVVTRIYPESVIKKYQSKINTLGSSTIIDVYTFLLSRLLLEIILFILLVLIPKYGLIISTITVIFIHFLYEDILITSKIMNREERLDKDALEGIPVGDIINVTDDQTYYAIMYDSSKDMKTFTAKFEKNGADSIDVKNGELSCNTLNDSCSITAPSFKKDGYEVLGWSTDKKAIKAEYKPGDIIKLTKDITLYAIYGEKLDTGTTENVDTGISSFIYVLVPIALGTGVLLYTKKIKRN